MRRQQERFDNEIMKCAVERIMRRIIWMDNVKTWPTGRSWEHEMRSERSRWKHAIAIVIALAGIG